MTTEKVTLKKTEAPSVYGAKYTPASYDVLVAGRKVGELVGRCQGRNGDGYWHELRDLAGRRVGGAVAVRGALRQTLNAAALELAADCA